MVSVRPFPVQGVAGGHQFLLRFWLDFGEAYLLDSEEHVVERPLARRLLRMPVSILDFASGYGCVARHFSVVMPDRLRHSSRSCRFHSHKTRHQGCPFGPRATTAGDARGFDVVFALSFFSHMPEATWGRWLHSLCAQLVRGEILIFTTHGMKSLPHFGPDAKLDNRGFYFIAQSEQTDLDLDEYGSTIVSYDYVCRQISASAPACLRTRRVSGMGIKTSTFCEEFDRELELISARDPTRAQTCQILSRLLQRIVLASLGGGDPCGDDFEPLGRGYSESGVGHS